MISDHKLVYISRVSPGLDPSAKVRRLAAVGANLTEKFAHMRNNAEPHLTTFTRRRRRRREDMSLLYSDARHWFCSFIFPTTNIPTLLLLAQVFRICGCGPVISAVALAFLGGRFFLPKHFPIDFFASLDIYLAGSCYPASFLQDKRKAYSLFINASPYKASRTIIHMSTGSSNTCSFLVFGTGKSSQGVRRSDDEYLLFLVSG